MQHHPPSDTPDADPSWLAVSDRILDAAVRCMRQFGARVSMQDVAVEAGVSRGALYRHYAGRAALVEAVIERIAAEVLDAAGQQVDEHEHLVGQVAAALRFMPRTRVEPLATALDEEPWRRAAWLAERWQGFWMPRLAAARERGEVRSDLGLPAAADWIARLQVSFVVLDTGTDPVTSHPDLEGYVDEHLLRGLGA